MNGVFSAKFYPHEEDISDFLPFVKGLSAKSYNFDSQGNETYLDYPRFLKLVKESNFDRYVGIEYEGENMSEPDGIRATKAMLEIVWSELV